MTKKYCGQITLTFQNQHYELCYYYNVRIGKEVNSYGEK